MVPAEHRATVADLLDLLIPADDWPGARAAGVLDILDAHYATNHAEAWREVLLPGLAALAREGGALNEGRLRMLEVGEAKEDWTVAPALLLRTLLRLAREALRRGADALGWETGPVPLLINSQARDGRGRCVQCGECVGFPCPSDAKNGSANTLLPSAVAAGATRVANCRAVRVVTDVAGRVTGAVLGDSASGATREVRAGQVVLAAGAIETARLLLASADDTHPTGMGNATDQVGRHLQGHAYGGALGLFDEPVIDSHGPGVSIGTARHYHGPDGPGGVLHNECVKLPALFWRAALPPDLRRWGLEGKHAMRDRYRRTGHVQGPVQELPQADSRVTLHGVVRDRWGVPVAHLTGPLHPETLRAAATHAARAAEWLEAAGAKEVWRPTVSAEHSAGQHQAGTCRMGDDPARSVTDREGRVHGHRNLWVADASLHVTNGGVNPVLTIYALALRTAGFVARARL